MNFLLVDLVGLVLIVAGTWLALAKPRQGRDSSVPRRGAEEDPRVYARRIAGFMVAAFGLAITVMFTTFHFA